MQIEQQVGNVRQTSQKHVSDLLESALERCFYQAGK